MNAGRRQRALELAVEALLLFLVWGLFAFQRGMWQDDALALSAAQGYATGTVAAWVQPLISSSRGLSMLPWLVAWVTPHPVWALQSMVGALWLAQAWLVRRLARDLISEDRLVAFTAGALALCATSDYLTNSMVALHYNLSAALLLASLAFGFGWLSRGGLRRLLLSAILFQASLWTTAIATPLLVALPLLAAVARVRTAALPRRAVIWVATIWAAAVPWALAFWRTLQTEGSYVNRSMSFSSGAQWRERWVDLSLGHFAPWRWAFDRPTWYSDPGPGLPLGLTVGAALAGATAYTMIACRSPRTQSEATNPSRRLLALAAILALLVVAIDGLMARIHLAHIWYRTHFLSRLWACLLIVLVSYLLARSKRRLGLAFVLPVTFVGLGVAGGIERQAFFGETWRAHQLELSSVIEEAPDIEPGTAVVLATPATPDWFLATEADYLASAWLRLLYDRPDMAVLKAAPDRRSGCRGSAAGLSCWREREEQCFASGVCPGVTVPYDRLLVLSYDRASGRYRLQHEMPVEWFHPSSRTYDPEARIRLPAPRLERLQRRLLLLD